MRILFISRCPPYPLHFGDRLILHHLARQLHQRGHQLDLIALYDRPEDGTPEAQQPYREMFDQLRLIPETKRTLPGYLQRLLIPNDRFPERAEETWNPDLWRAVVAYLGHTGPDVVHVFGGVQVYEIAQSIAGLPKLITPYESFALYLKRQQALATHPIEKLSFALQRYIAQQYERFMFTPFANVTVVSPVDAAEIAQVNPELKLSVIPNGIDTDYFAPRPDFQRDPLRLLFTGNFEYAPNVDAALYLIREVLPRVRQHHPSASLWLVGHAPPNTLQAFASDHVILTGRVPDIRPYFAEAGLFVCPLRLGAGIKNKVLEALAMGCPVVATPLSVDGIAVEHERSALIAPLSAFANTVLHALSEPTLRDQLSVQGQALIEARYTWERTADAYEQLYLDAGGSGQKRPRVSE